MKECINSKEGIRKTWGNNAEVEEMKVEINRSQGIWNFSVNDESKGQHADVEKIINLIGNHIRLLEEGYNLKDE